MMVTSTGARFSFRAAFRPPKPPPIMTTRCAITSHYRHARGQVEGAVGLRTIGGNPLVSPGICLTLHRLNADGAGSGPEMERESGPRPGRGLNRHRTAVAPHNIANDCEAEAAAGRSVRRRPAGTEKRLEDALKVFGSDAGTRILDINFSGAHNDPDFAARVHGRAGVAEKIVERAINTGLVAENGVEVFRDFNVETYMFRNAGVRREPANGGCEVRRLQRRRFAAAPGEETGSESYASRNRGVG